MNAEDLAASRFRPIRAVREQIAKTEGAHRKATEQLEELRGRWRVSAANAKTGKARWVTPPDVLVDAVVALCPRDDRTAARRVGVRGCDGRPVADGADQGVYGGCCSVVQPARPPTPPRDAHASRRRTRRVGSSEARPLGAGASADVRPCGAGPDGARLPGRARNVLGRCPLGAHSKRGNL